jgi:ParB-like chromosome segregation protein Spo0J
VSKLKDAEERKRLELYHAGFDDAAIARALGKSQEGIRKWRRARNLPLVAPAKRGRPSICEAGGVKMEEALTPEECEKVRQFLRVLLTYYREVPPSRKADVRAFMAAYRHEKGAKHAWSGVKRSGRDGVTAGGGTA